MARECLQKPERFTLTDTSIRKAKPTDKVQHLFDAGGLYPEIAKTGGK